MKTYGCSGTLGDTYLNLCILYHIAIKECIICRHYTVVKSWSPLIRQIYSLLPNIHIEFVNERDTLHTRIYALFSLQEKHGDELNTQRDWCFFPKFVFMTTNFNLPPEYMVLCPKSGKPSENRDIKDSTIDKIIRTSKLPIVIIGTSKDYINIIGKNIINLVGRTSLLEAICIVSNATSFVGFQGLMSFVAMSHRVPSYIHTRQPYDVKAVQVRTPKQWEKYCCIIND